jgi:hypothetical protein
MGSRAASFKTKRMHSIMRAWGHASLVGLARVGVHRSTVTRMEADKVTHRPTIAAMVRALEEAGIEFLNSAAPGVRLKK